MKKFCNKITRQQWRVTVPNSGVIFRKSENNENNSRNSGLYDLELAQKEYDKSRSLPSSVYVETDNSSCTSSDEDEDFEDARGASSTKTSDFDAANEEIDELYADVSPKKSQNITNNNSAFQYDVPKISFKFFESRISNTTKKESTYENQELSSTPIVMKSEMKITLKSSPDDEHDEIQEVQIVRKSGSDPSNLHLLPIAKSEQDELDDNFYKVPRDLNRCRFSQSLHDFNLEDFQRRITPCSSHSSIEHISCSQVIASASAAEEEEAEEKNNLSESLEYCKARSRLPMILRRPTFLRKPPRRAVDTWNNFRTRFNTILQEQAAQQRVGAYTDKETKISVVRFEEVYKNSKLKCKNAFRSTTKLFRKPSESNISDNSSQIVKNDAFFARVITPNDIQYKFDRVEENGEKINSDVSNKIDEVAEIVYKDDEEKRDFSTIRSAFRWHKSSQVAEGQNGFDDLRRYVKQGGDFCKELAIILQERAETEAQYAKNLSKLSSKLSKACRDGVGGINEAWKAVAVELETRAEIHRLMGQALLEETAKPLRTLTENQHRTRKQCESVVDKAAKGLSDWRAAEAKGKKQSHSCARDNEKLQDAAVLDTSRSGKLTLSRSTSFIQLAHKEAKNNNSEKENAKLEGKKKKAEDAVKKADIEYYTLCVKAERARLEWESAVLRGVNTFQSLEEERLSNLKVVLNSYLHYQAEQGPRLVEVAEKLKGPIDEAESGRDLTTFVNLRQSSQQVAEQLLPDFYCEHITLAMNRERRKQALVKLLNLIRQDIERERKSKNGLEKLSKAIKQTPNFGAEDSQQSVSEKLYHMKSMLTYLEGARYKIQNALAELDSKPRSGHPLQPHITITRDKSGLQQSVLKVPQWLREDWLDGEKSPVSEKSVKSHKSDNSDPHNNDIAEDWNDRGAADGNSNQPDSDFDEFSSQCSSSGNLCNGEDTQIQPIAQCKALYAYIPKLSDELALQPGDFLSVYQQQDDGWWFGECRGNYGTFPATYVELIN